MENRCPIIHTSYEAVLYKIRNIFITLTVLKHVKQDNYKTHNTVLDAPVAVTAHVGDNVNYFKLNVKR